VFKLVAYSNEPSRIKIRVGMHMI